MAHAGSGNRLIELDVTRGLAAVVVFFCHVFALDLQVCGRDSIRCNSDSMLFHLFDGAAAVDFFFVLSGLVLSLAYLDGSAKSIAVDSFVLRRFIRIMPTYWACLALSQAVRAATSSYVSGPAGDLIDWSQAVSTHQFIAHWALIFGRLNTVLIDGPIWSLAVEMKLSLLLPLVIAALQPTQSIAGCAAVLIVTCCVGLGSQGSFSFMPLFVLGALLARYKMDLVRSLRIAPRRTRLVLVAVACALFWNRVVYSRRGPGDPLQDWMSGAAAGIFLLHVLAGLYPLTLTNNFITRFLGRISYSFYLIHLPIFYATTIALRARGVGPILIFPVAAGTVLAGATALYTLIESPSVTLGRWLMRHHTQQPNVLES